MGIRSREDRILAVHLPEAVARPPGCLGVEAETKTTNDDGRRPPAGAFAGCVLLREGSWDPMMIAGPYDDDPNRPLRGEGGARGPRSSCISGWAWSRAAPS